MEEAQQLSIETGHTPVSLRFSGWTGFVGFGLDLGASVALRGHACKASAQYELHMVTFICMAIVVAGFLAAWSILRRLPADKKEEGGHPHDRAHFQALMAIAFNAAFFVAILANAVPRWMLNACQ